MSKLAPIPIPLAQRWRDARLRLIPAFVLTAAILAIGFLWKDYVAAPTMIGQAEPILANVSSYKPGML
ncbi:MAG: Multidrug resistance protein MdtN, partial [Pedosphaera sp.]|nr:Multidrug resistance protein MdtN [Pedosphaera sp.]